MVDFIYLFVCFRDIFFLIAVNTPIFTDGVIFPHSCFVLIASRSTCVLEPWRKLSLFPFAAFKPAE